MPTRQEIKPAGNDVFADCAEFSKERKYTSILGEQERDIFGMVLTEIDFFQWIQFHRIKERSCLRVEVNPDRVSLLILCTIIDMNAFTMESVIEFRVQPQNIAISSEDEFCFWQIVNRHINQNVDIGIFFL
jgi:hypothetical protein